MVQNRVATPFGASWALAEYTNTSHVRMETDGPTGAGYVRFSFLGTPSRTPYWSVRDLSGNFIPVSVGEVVCSSLHVRTSSDRLNIRLTLIGHTGATSGGWIGVAPLPVVAGPTSWTRLSTTVIIPPGVSYLRMLSEIINVSDVVSGDTFDTSCDMLTSGPIPYAYADGSFPGWTWDGAPNASTSHGWATSAA